MFSQKKPLEDCELGEEDDERVAPNSSSANKKFSENMPNDITEPES